MMGAAGRIICTYAGNNPISSLDPSGLEASSQNCNQPLKRHGPVTRREAEGILARSIGVSEEVADDLLRAHQASGLFPEGHAALTP